MFQLNLLPRLDIPSSTVDGKKVYNTPEGDFLSVTTIIKKVLGTKALDNWRERIGDERANEISAQASFRGHAIHELAEAYLTNDPNWFQLGNPVNLHTFRQIKPYLNDHIGTILGIELPLYSKKIQAGGQADLIAEWDGVNAVIDFKTSLRKKQEKWIEHYFIQATAYSVMMAERYNINCPRIVVVIMVDHEEPQIFIKRRKDYLQRTLDIFDAVEIYRLTQPAR